MTFSDFACLSFALYLVSQHKNPIERSTLDVYVLGSPRGGELCNCIAILRQCARALALDVQEGHRRCAQMASVYLMLVHALGCITVGKHSSLGSKYLV